MSKKSISELKEYFQAGKRPTESQFGDFIDSYVHQDESSEYSVTLEFPADYQIGDYIEFVNFYPAMALAAGFYEISVAYTRGNIASAATHIASISHANPNVWRECGRVNMNNYVDVANTNCFTIDVNGATCIFRIRATSVYGNTDSVMYVTIKIRSINKNISWTARDVRGNDSSTSIPLQPMTREWDLYVGDLRSLESAKVGLKVNSQGNVGIGTSSPQGKLHVGDNTKAGVVLDNRVSNIQSKIPAQIYWSESTSTRIAGDLVIAPRTDISANIAFYTNNGSGVDERMKISGNGNVGIGTASPLSKLHLNSAFSTPDQPGDFIIGDVNLPNLRMGTHSQYTWVQSHAGSPLYLNPIGNNLILNKDAGSVGVGLENPQTKLDVNGLITSSIRNGAVSPSNTAAFSLNELGNNVFEMSYARDGQGVGVIKTIYQNHIGFGTNNTERLRIHGVSGNVGIGTKNPDQKLTVKGKIHAEDVIVDMNVPADYVFQKYYDNYSSIREDYSMMSLNELESFIKENKHLPEIPSGDKMTQDGVTLGDFQMKLLQKIEELTLYMITQNKEIEELKSQLNK